MDIKLLDAVGAAEKGLTFFLEDADGVETDIQISVVGVGSRAYKAAKQIIDAKESNAYKRGKPLSEEEKEDMWGTLAAKCTTGWSNLQADGKDIPFSVEKATEIYKAYPFIGNQVAKQIANLQVMMGNLNASSKSSAK